MREPRGKRAELFRRPEFDEPPPSVLVPCGKYDRKRVRQVIAESACYYARKWGWKFATRSVPEGVRVVRVA